MSDPLWQSLFPYASHSIDLGGYKYAYIDEGKSDDPLVAVHGNPTWSFYWRRLIERFAPRRRVLAVDHIGCGRSDKPQRYPYSLASHRDNLISWLERLELRNVTLVVHDWGGAIGLAAAAAVPERIGRLVVTNTGAFPPPYVPWRIAACRWPIVGTAAVRGLNAFAQAATWMATARYRRLPPAVRGGLLAPYGSWAERVAIARFVQDIPTRRSHPTYAVLADLEARLPELADKPTLLIWGMRDWCFRPECLDRFLSIWPAAQKVQLAAAGHYVMEDAPDEALAAIEEFLAEDRSAAAPERASAIKP